MPAIRLIIFALMGILLCDTAAYTPLSRDSTPVKTADEENEILVEEEESTIPTTGSASNQQKVSSSSLPKAQAAQTTTPNARDILVEEGEEVIAVEEGPVASSDTLSVKPAPPSSPPKASAVHRHAHPAAEDGTLVEQDTAEASMRSAPPSQPTPVLKEPPTPVVTESRAINFAENLKQYRSPRLAMLLSALLPGLGQAYCRSNWKAGTFVAVELSAIVASFGFYNRGKQIEKKAWRYADRHYSPAGFNAWYDSLWHALEQKGGANYADSILKDEIFVFYDTAFDTVQLRMLYEKRRSDASFYSYIQDDNFIYGWADAVPSLASFKDRLQSPLADTAYRSGDTVIVSSAATADSLYFKYDRYVRGKLIDEKKYGFSDYYNTYRHLLRDRDQHHRWAGYLLYVVVLNHIVSAIDAGITAKAYNDRLLGKQSLWQRIHVEPVWVDAGAGVRFGAALSIDL